MPIYAYKCASCGFAKDVLQKLSDAQLTQCPQCAAQAFSKQITAAGFQLKGSGWYATDFRGGATKPAENSTDKAPDTAKTETKAETKSESKTEAKPAESAPPKSDTPSASGGCGASCGCH